MPFSDKIGKLNDALFPTNPSKETDQRIGAFGGEATGFAHGVETLFAKSFYANGSVPDVFGVAVGMNSVIPRSIFNRYALFNFRGLYGGLTGGEVFNNFFDKPDNPAMGGNAARNLSISKLMEYFNTHYPRISYTAQDFLYCKYYKQIPVNHLITLRRFPTPVNDNIFDLSLSPGSKDPNSPEPGEAVDATQTAGVTAVTYMGEKTGNKLDDILKMSYGLNYKEVKSEMEDISSGDGGYTTQPFYSKMGGVGKATADAFKGISSRQKFASQNMSTGDKLGTTYANFVIGPVNVIDSTNVRDRGMKFSNDLKLNFEYELKSLNYINPKIAMIDVISNMLTMTYNNGQFFGGGQRYYGSAGAVASQFGDINKLKQGDFSGYIGSVVTDVETGFKNVFGGGTGEFNLDNGIEGLLKVGKTMLGNMLGGFLSDNVGAVSGTQATKALISAEPTGDWHVTVGNPLNPIVTMGNMYCDNTTMTLGKGLGYDDFPMEVKFEIDLKHGKPRDKGDIENMFNAGRGRIYASAQGEEDILNLAGLDVATYGSVKAGKSTVSPTQSAPAGSAKSNKIQNIKNNPNKQATSDSGEYISNVVSMFIDS
mgnify:CR=1 FL=1|tara:strand:+ start:6954 stop:8738 length:1785 start_codon:yes stop_codon:yes gene_type:complete